MPTPKTSMINVPRKKSNGFTLVELLAVIVIIAILAGMVLGISSWAQENAARKKTSTFMESIKLGIENYKQEFGEVPTSPQGDYTGNNGAKVLYQAITGDGDSLLGGDNESDGKTTREEGSWNPIMDPISAGGKGLVLRDHRNKLRDWLVDGFGQPWNYRPFDKESGAQNFNQGKGSYDLWSYGKDSSKSDESKWIKNW